MDPNIWASLRSTPDSRRNGHPTGNEQTFSLAQSAVGLDLQLLIQQQRLAASGFSTGFSLLNPAAYGNYNIQCSTAGNIYLPYNPLSTGEDGIAAGAQFTFPTQPQFETLLKAQQQTIQQFKATTTDCYIPTVFESADNSGLALSSNTQVVSRNSLTPCNSSAANIGHNTPTTANSSSLHSKTRLFIFKARLDIFITDIKDVITVNTEEAGAVFESAYR